MPKNGLVGQMNHKEKTDYWQPDSAKSDKKKCCPASLPDSARSLCYLASIVTVPGILPRSMRIIFLSWLGRCGLRHCLKLD